MTCNSLLPSTDPGPSVERSNETSVPVSPLGRSGLKPSLILFVLRGRKPNQRCLLVIFSQQCIVYTALPSVPPKALSVTGLLKIHREHTPETIGSLDFHLYHRQDASYSCHSNWPNPMLPGLPWRRECHAQVSHSQITREPALALPWFDEPHFGAPISGRGPLCQRLHQGQTDTEQRHQLHPSHVELKLFLKPSGLCHQAEVV